MATKQLSPADRVAVQVVLEKLKAAPFTSMADGRTILKTPRPVFSRVAVALTFSPTPVVLKLGELRVADAA
jgi:hypothetical protein